MLARSVRVRRIVELVSELELDERTELEVQLLADISARGELEDLVIEAQTVAGSPRRETLENRLPEIARRIARVETGETATLSLEEVEASIRADLDF